MLRFVNPFSKKFQKLRGQELLVQNAIDVEHVLTGCGSENYFRGVWKIERRLIQRAKERTSLNAF